MGRWFQIVLAATLATVAAPRDAEACFCLDPPRPCQLGQTYPVIFLGTVEAVSRNAEGQGLSRGVLAREPSVRVRFRVNDGFRGADTDSIEVHTFEESGACGVPFKAGRQYLVFASAEDGLISTSMCSGTDLAENSRDTLAFFRTTWRRPSPVGWIEARLIARFGSDFGKLRVTFESKGHKTLATLTHPGDFQVPVPTGTHKMNLEVPKGWVGSISAMNGDADEVTLTEPRGCVEAFAEIHPDGHLFGRVVSASGTPIAYLPLTLSTARARDDEVGSMTVEERTDSQGRYEFKGIPPRGYNLTAEAIYAVPQWAPTNSPTRSVITMLPGARMKLSDYVMPSDMEFVALSGTVLDSNGHPVDNARVAGCMGSAIRTDARGYFNLALLVGMRCDIDVKSHDDESNTPAESASIYDLYGKRGMAPIVIRLQRK